VKPRRPATLLSVPSPIQVTQFRLVLPIALKDQIKNHMNKFQLTKYSEIPKFVPGGHYTVTIDWDYVPSWIADKAQHSLELDPDFQRAHVWTQEKQIRYIEFILRGGESSRTIYWNCPGWMDTYKGPMVLVDGKQRLEAVRAFLDNEIPAFGSVYSEWEPRLLRMARAHFFFNINNLSTRAEVLQWYLDLNSGGVVHTDEELQKVRALLVQEQTKDALSPRI
jgi:hypothetical protein